jgi:hypothetical protein
MGHATCSSMYVPVSPPPRLHLKSCRPQGCAPCALRQIFDPLIFALRRVLYIAHQTSFQGAHDQAFSEQRGAAWTESGTAIIVTCSCTRIDRLADTLQQ